ncbi:hypothetical protein HELRODRAFT_149301, partial [Helobdella robusta]|uniref:Cilia- and flagella-associated protein 91 n=1 Tax=Helobdella robusta TaxID=6412 RepID=T1EKC5_HELRO
IAETTSTLTQTDLREGVTQTEPYTPEYYVPKGTTSELLSIAMLSYGCGLPAGLAEVEMIERMRTKRIWELEQMQLSEKCQVEKRMKKMEEQHALEWSVRDAEIQRILDLRLKVTMKMLRLREGQTDEINRQRLEDLWNRKEEEAHKKLAKLKFNNLRALRKISGKECLVERKILRRDVVKDYTDFGSQAFAPLTRIGVFLDMNAAKYEFDSYLLSSLQGVTELEDTLNRKQYNCNIRIRPKSPNDKIAVQRRRRRREKELERIYDSIQKEKELLSKSPKPLKFLQKIEKPAVRPPTPTASFESEVQDNKKLAITFLQQMIRGRHSQATMLQGKEERMELIKELRSTHALLQSEQSFIEAHKQKTLEEQDLRARLVTRDDVVDSLISELEGETLSDCLDFLTKELDRLKEERRIEAFVMLAERNRRIREAEESGMRQIEERRRREADEAFKQIVKVHQDTVDSYLEDIILKTIDSNADMQARKLVQQTAIMIDEAANKAENSRSTMDSEEIVAQLVLGFLIPEVFKQDHNNKSRSS